MQFEQDPVNVLTPLPAQNIDTGLGLNRLAAILQGTTSIFDTDQFVPLIALGEQLSGQRAGPTSTWTARCASSPTTPAACPS